MIDEDLIILKLTIIPNVLLLTQHSIFSFFSLALSFFIDRSHTILRQSKRPEFIRISRSVQQIGKIDILFKDPPQYSPARGMLPKAQHISFHRDPSC